MAKKRKTTKAEHYLEQKKNNKIGCLFDILVVLSIIPCVYTFREYNTTFIPISYIIIFYIITGLIFGYFTEKFYRRINGNINKGWRYYLLSIFIFGSIFSSFFFLTNIYFSTYKNYTINTQILEWSETRTRHHYFVKVNIDGFKKNIPVPNENSSTFGNFNFIELTCKKGLWGFPFVVTYKLKN